MALTVEDAITAIVTQADALAGTSTAEDLVYLAKSLQAVSDTRQASDATVQAVVDRANALSAGATSEDLIYLAKAVEALSTASVIADVTAEGNTQVARVTAEGGTQDARVLNRGDIQDARVAAEGNTQYQRVVDEGSTQVNRVATTMEATIAAGGFTRYDLASVSTTTTLDLASANEFTVDASVARTLSFVNAPGSGRAMTVVLTISGASAITWPAGIRWHGDGTTAPELGATWTIVVLSWDGANWSGVLGASA